MNTASARRTTTGALRCPATAEYRRLLSLGRAPSLCPGATGNETPATATDPANWDSATSGYRTNQTLQYSSDSINCHRFVLTQESEGRIGAMNQDVWDATLKITNNRGDMIFHQNRRGTRGPGSNPVHHDAVDWRVIGPGTRYIRIEQTGSTLNTFDLVWKLRDRVVLPNDDFYGGVWSEGLMHIEGSTDGKILNAEGRAGKDSTG